MAFTFNLRIMEFVARKLPWAIRGAERMADKVAEKGFNAVVVTIKTIFTSKTPTLLRSIFPAFSSSRMTPKMGVKVGV